MSRTLRFSLRRVSKGKPRSKMPAPLQLAALTIIQALSDPKLFGALPAFASLETWKSWIVLLKVIFCLPLDDDEVGLFRKCTGRTIPPKKILRELYLIVGRRGGKSWIVSIIAIFLACFRDYSQ